MHLSVVGAVGAQEVGGGDGYTDSVGWGLSVGASAHARLHSLVSLQGRGFFTFVPTIRELGVGCPDCAGPAITARYLFGEMTLRLHPLSGAFFLGLGGQLGARLAHTYVIGPTDKSLVGRGVFEVGTTFGPNDMFEIAGRFAQGAVVYPSSIASNATGTTQTIGGDARPDGLGRVGRR